MHWTKKGAPRAKRPKAAERISRTIPAIELLEARDVPTYLGNQIFPVENPWNQNISQAPAHANNTTIIANLNLPPLNLHLDWSDVYGIPINVVNSSVPDVMVGIGAYWGESDNITTSGTAPIHRTFLPIPAAGVAIEGDPNNSSGDRHLIIYDQSTNELHETGVTIRPSGAITYYRALDYSYWDLDQNWFRPQGWTSVDAAGLPIMPGLARPDEIFGQGVVNHPLRFTLDNPKILNDWIYPGSHRANEPNNSPTIMPPMGSRFRLNATYYLNNIQNNPSWLQASKVMALGLVNYGLILADNGTSWYITGEKSPRWTEPNPYAFYGAPTQAYDWDTFLDNLQSIPGSAFEMVDLTPIVTSLSASSGPTGTVLTINGKNFTGAGGRMHILFNSTEATTFAILSDSQISVTVPAGSGTVDVFVQSGEKETNFDNDSDDIPVLPNPRFWGYGTSANTAADNFTYTVGPQIGVSGNSTNIADDDSTPSLSDFTSFGSVLVGSNLDRTYTIANNGSAALTVNTVAVTGTGFSVFTQPASSVAVGGTTTFVVRFAPTATGIISGTVSFANNDTSKNPFNFSIAGTGVAPEIAVSGNGVQILDEDSTPITTDFTDFSDVLVGATLNRTYTISNSGTAALTVGTVMVTGTGFSVFTQPAASVAAGGTTTFVVRFGPTSLGAVSGSISFTTNDSDENPFNFSIAGKGVAPEIAVTGNSTDITNGDSIPSGGDFTDFGDVNVGSTLNRTYTISNSGTAALTIGTVTVTGTGFSVFTQPAGSVAAAGTTTFVVRFAPIFAGAITGTVSFATNDSSENPFNFSIAGKGVAPEIAVSGNSTNITDGGTMPSSTDHTSFGHIVPGSALDRTYTIANVGSASLTIGTVTVTGTGFSVFTQPASSVAAGGTTTFVIRFAPAVTGTAAGSVSFSNNDGNENPFNFSIVGNGTVVSGNGVNIADGDTTPSNTDHTDFGTVTIGSTFDRTYTISNSGAANLKVGTVTVTGTGFSVLTQPAQSVAPGGTTTVVVRFAPLAMGTVSGTVSFSIGAQSTTRARYVYRRDFGFDENPFNFNIAATGAAAQQLLAAPQAGSQAPMLEQAELDRITQAAIERRVAAGISGAQLAQLQQTQLQVADLQGGLLGMTQGSEVVIDINAGGYGWFVDPTPELDEEFGQMNGEWHALTGRGAAGRVDLLTVVSHELGHVLGLADLDDSGELMAGQLPLGMRRSADVDEFFRLL